MKESAGGYTLIAVIPILPKLQLLFFWVGGVLKPQPQGVVV